MKITAFFNPENMKEFLAGGTDILYLSYVCDEKYYGMLADLDIDNNWKFEIILGVDFIEMKKKNGR